MRRHHLFSLSIQAATLLVFTLSETLGQDKKEWTWKDKENQTRTLADLKNILELHNAWVRSGGKSGSPADLSHTYLAEIDLRPAFYNKMGFTGFPDYISLRGAYLRDAKLQHSAIIDVDLTGANLEGADLSEAFILNTELKDAWLWAANLKYTNFQPRSLPDIKGIAWAKNLEYLWFGNDPTSLNQLRKELKERAYREPERKVTYAIKKSEDRLLLVDCKTGNPLKCVWYGIKKVVFDFTCQYGMNTVRPISLLGGLWLICSLIYYVFIRFGRRSGLYRVEKVSKRSGEHSDEIWIRVGPLISTSIGKYFKSFILREWRVLRVSMFFSLMSAFNIGFRDVNFGRWLRLLTRREYDIKPVWWTRTVSGWQALISLYLLALWIFVYFGRPFE